MVFQSPPSFKATDENIKNSRDFFESIKEELRIGWEIRDESWLKRDERREYAPFLSELLGSGVIWVEESTDMLLILTEEQVERVKVKKLEDLMRKEVKCAPINAYKNLYVGLKLNGRCSGVGIMKSFDPLSGKAEVLTRYGGDVDSIVFGFIRLSEDGEELGVREVDSP